MRVNQNTNKTHCKYGHAFEGDNLYIAPNGWRVCRICNNAAQKKYANSSLGAIKSKQYRLIHKKDRLISSKKRRAANRLYVSNIKSHPCSDCKIKYPSYVMDLDHCRGTKILSISSMVDTGVSVNKLREEINKCDVVCSNCHRIRTYNRRELLLPT